jgi:hypothetical protein
MSQAGFEPTIPVLVFERSKTVRALDRAAIATCGDWNGWSFLSILKDVSDYGGLLVYCPGVYAKNWSIRRRYDTL